MKKFINWQKTGKRLKHLINEKGYTIRTFAAMLNMSESTVKNYIYAGTQISVDTLYQMVDILDLKDLSDILEEE